MFGKHELDESLVADVILHVPFIVDELELDAESRLFWIESILKLWTQAARMAFQEQILELGDEVVT